MELGADEASLIHEDRTGETDTCSQHGDSEDEDIQKEMELMLYSHVYFDDSSIQEATDIDSSFGKPSVTVKPLEAESKQLKSYERTICRNERKLHAVRPQLPPGCSPSQFNHPNRIKASRYYDLPLNRSHRMTYVAPPNPNHRSSTVESDSRNEFTTPTDFTVKLMARSANEKSYLPSSKKSKLPATRGHTNVVSVEPTQNKSSLVKENQASVICKQLASKNDDQSEEALNISTIEKKTIKQSSARSRHSLSAKKSFEDKVSMVFSSMLDDESRLSLDEHPPSSCANQIQKGVNSDSGWSVGMSWADMSSKSFEVDIEEESVSSLQCQDNSFTADSGTNTPDGDGQIEISRDINDDPPEPSRYSLRLRDKGKENEDSHETDCESEASSIVEVAPPVKPAPDLVDISDTDDVSLNDIQDKILKPKPSSGRDIIILLSRKKTVVELTIDSSSDDGKTYPVVIDERRQSSKSDEIQAHISPRESTKRTLEEPSGPRKRFSGRKDHESTVLQTRTSDLTKENNIDELDQWLYDPIKSSRYLDHTKLLRKMSDDPKLWKICPADICGMKSSSSPRGAKCINCKQFGHKPKFCPEPQKVSVCHMCGAPGHLETRCPQKMCLKCGSKNNVFVDRCKECAKRFSDPCQICRSHTHYWRKCPDLWRRYHMTVAEGEIACPDQEDIIAKDKHYCSNCAGKGHLSHECKKSQWKCESISPFIVSYQSPSSEDRKLGGTNKFAMLLADDTAEFLSSVQGHDFLKVLSEELNVIIHLSFDLDVKKIVLDGTSMDVREARTRIQNWVKGQKNPGKWRSMNMSLTKRAADHWSSPEGKTYLQKLTKEFDVVIDSNTHAPVRHLRLMGQHMAIQQAWAKIKEWISQQNKMELIAEKAYICHLPPPLPKRNFSKLADAVEEEIKLMESPELTNFTVKQIYDCMCCNIGKARKCCARLLCMILLGKCGFAGGNDDVKALKTLVSQLREKKGSLNELYDKVKYHYQPIFAGDFRNDFESLVGDFYSNEALVKKFERGVVSPDPCAVAVNHVQSALSRSNSSRGPKLEKPASASQNRPSGTVHTNSATAEDDVWPQKAVNEDCQPVQTLSKKLKKKRQKKNSLSAKSHNVFAKYVSAVIKNLSSRFIVSADQQALVKMFDTYSNKRANKKQFKQKFLLDMKILTEKLRKSHKINV